MKEIPLLQIQSIELKCSNLLHVEVCKLAKRLVSEMRERYMHFATFSFIQGCHFGKSDLKLPCQFLLNRNTRKLSFGWSSKMEFLCAYSEVVGAAKNYKIWRHFLFVCFLLKIANFSKLQENESNPKVWALDQQGGKCMFLLNSYLWNLVC